MQSKTHPATEAEKILCSKLLNYIIILLCKNFSSTELEYCRSFGPELFEHKEYNAECQDEAKCGAMFEVDGIRAYQDAAYCLKQWGFIFNIAGHCYELTLDAANISRTIEQMKNVNRELVALCIGTFFNIDENFGWGSEHVSGIEIDSEIIKDFKHADLVEQVNGKLVWSDAITPYFMSSLRHQKRETPHYFFQRICVDIERPPVSTTEKELAVEILKLFAIISARHFMECAELHKYLNKPRVAFAEARKITRLFGLGISSIIAFKLFKAFKIFKRMLGFNSFQFSRSDQLNARQRCVIYFYFNLMPKDLIMSYEESLHTKKVISFYSNDQTNNLSQWQELFYNLNMDKDHCYESFVETLSLFQLLYRDTATDLVYLFCDVGSFATEINPQGGWKNNHIDFLLENFLVFDQIVGWNGYLNWKFESLFIEAGFCEIKNKKLIWSDKFLAFLELQASGFDSFELTKQPSELFNGTAANSGHDEAEEI